MREVRTRATVLLNARLSDGGHGSSIRRADGGRDRMGGASGLVRSQALTTLRVENGLIASLGEPPRPDDLCVDLRGDRVLPGLINAHDHLQLNGLPRLKYRDGYQSATEWIDDIRPRLACDPMLLANSAVPREERLLIGGIKNLLSGVTTVAHHDPLYPSLLDPGFPVRIVERYGWSHSLALDGEESVVDSFRRTAVSDPWIIHAAEGVDEVAAAEIDRLGSLGCLAANTVIVHGLAMGSSQHRDLARSGGGLVWCPTSNLHLFGRTIEVAKLELRSHVALGSDSRLSGGRDLLDELRAARTITSLQEEELEAMVTDRAAAILRMPDRGVIRPGALADLVVLPQGAPLSETERTDVALVLIGGEPRYSDPKYAFAFGEEGCSPVQVDGHPKCMARALVARLDGCRVREPGLVSNTHATRPFMEPMRGVAG